MAPYALNAIRSRADDSYHLIHDANVRWVESGYSSSLTRLVLPDMDVPIFLKKECELPTHSFKVRGALIAVSRCRERGYKEILAASTGNHSQAIAWVARLYGMKATIIMPTTAAPSKVAKTKQQGATVISHGNNLAEASLLAQQQSQKHNIPFVHAYDNDDIISGQATIAHELAPFLAGFYKPTIVVPMGGGGLATGMALGLEYAGIKARLIGVQSAQVPALYNAFHCGQLTSVPFQPTLADGSAVTQPVQRTFEVIQRCYEDIVLVTEEEIRAAIYYAATELKMVLEGAGATPLAALMAKRITLTGPVVLIGSGGNIAPEMLASILSSF